jgi:ribosomal protein S18 acetylase RimI-like enzyme
MMGMQSEIREIRLRRATAADELVLWQMLYYAAHMAEDGATSSDAARANPFLAQYVMGWGQADDLGIVAETSAGEIVGAAWLRLLISDPTSVSYYDDQTPELAIAVAPDWMGRGVGTKLLEGLLAAARAHFRSIVLTVRADNPAVRLYQRCGFTLIDEIVNRVGTRSYKLLWTSEESR